MISVIDRELEVYVIYIGRLIDRKSGNDRSINENQIGKSSNFIISAR